jgi:hypothetical protein
MPTYTAYYRIQWWLVLAGPFLVVACEWLAWAIIHPDMLAEIHGRRSGIIHLMAETLSPPVAALIFAAFGLMFAWAIIALVVASIQHKPSFQLDDKGVTSFPLYSRTPRFIAWGDIERIQTVKNAVSLTSGRRAGSASKRVGITLTKETEANFVAALTRHRPDLVHGR